MKENRPPHADYVEYTLIRDQYKHLCEYIDYVASDVKHHTHLAEDIDDSEGIKVIPTAYDARRIETYNSICVLDDMFDEATLDVDKYQIFDITLSGNCKFTLDACADNTDDDVTEYREQQESLIEDDRFYENDIEYGKPSYKKPSDKYGEEIDDTKTYAKTFKAILHCEGHTPSWSGGTILWENGEVSYSESGINIVEMITLDNGKTWYASIKTGFSEVE